VLLEGPTHVFKLVNPNYQQLFPNRKLLGLPLREALPELMGQGFFEVLDQVYQSGEPVQLPEAETWADFAGAGQLEQRCYTAWFLPFRAASGQVTGVLNISFDVTEQVLVRQQLQTLNQELETRVQQRTRELTEQQNLLSQILGQVPALVATLSGPEHRFSFFNEPYQALVAGRAQLGRSVAELLPEVVEQGFTGLLDQVYATGEPYIGTETPALLYNAHTG
jgi:hypothetical protein